MIASSERRRANSLRVAALRRSSACCARAWRAGLSPGRATAGLAAGLALAGFAPRGAAGPIGRASCPGSGRIGMPGRGGNGSGVAGFFNAATFFGGGAAFFAAGFFLGAALLRVVIHALRRGREARKILVPPCGSSQRNRLNAYTF